MKFSPSFAFVCLALAACSPTPGLQPAGGGWSAVPSVSADDYALQDVGVLGLSGQESLAEAGAAIRSRLGVTERVEGNYAETLKLYSAQIIGQPRGAVVLTQSQLPDDSIRGLQHVVEFDISRETEAATPVSYGQRQQCYRAADPDGWTNRPCP